jgi:hypothetical protein
MRTPGEFAAALFGHELDNDLRIATWTLRNRRSDWWPNPQSIDYLAGRDDTYIGVALTIDAAASTYGRKRMPAEDAVAIGGLWIDVDINGGPKSNGKPVTDGAPTLDEARDLLHHALPPTLTVNSGYGLHGWWLLPQRWRFTGYHEQHQAALLAVQWVTLHQREARRRGYKIDSVGDLARIMRLPCTWNAKAGRRAAVNVLDDSGPRYGLDELAAYARAAGPVSLPTPARHMDDSGHRGGAVRVRTGAEPPADKLHALRINSPEFEATWTGQRPEFGDDRSAYDMSLALLAVQAGWTDDEIGALIGTFRGWDDKALRSGRFEDVWYEREYLVRTITNARRSLERQPAA